ncbi:hypothetical protein Btru_028499 [Bulinus truncatus]|nr:hypothetical protein Btru_028499 [Bulinus truncatus]
MNWKFLAILVITFATKLGHIAESQRIDVYHELLNDGKTDSSILLTTSRVDHFIQTLFDHLTCEAQNSTSDLCNKTICFNTTDLLSLMSSANTSEVSRDHFTDISLLMVYYIHHIDSVCHKRVDISNSTLYDARTFMKNLTSTKYGLQDFITTLKPHMKDVHHNHSELDSELSSVSHLVIKEKCLSEDAIIYYMNSAEVLDVGQLASIISFMIYAEFEIQDTCLLLPKKDAFVKEILNIFGNGTVLNMEGLQSLMELLDILPASNPSSDSEQNHDHRKKRSIKDSSESVLANILSRRSKRQTAPAIKECYTANQLLALYDSVDGADQAQFEQLCPALLHQKLYGVCKQTAESLSISDAEKYGYGTLAVLIICLCSILGLIIVPCASRKVYNSILASFLGLAVGTLFADAILHLIPMAMGIHDHGEEGHAHEDASEIIVEDYVKYGLAIIGGLYGFYILELFMENLGHHSHSHDEHCHSEHNHNENSYQISEASTENSKTKYQSEQEAIEKPKKGVTPLAVMIILGDGLHNLADGLAIGAAFTGSLSVGVGTSIAIFCHELPHELGDFAVLVQSGMSVKKALGLNFISALTAFVGLYIGLGVSSNDVVRSWIFAVTAGMFIYIALVDLMPILIKSKSPLDLVLNNLGILTGIAIMLIIAIFEEHIKI